MTDKQPKALRLADELVQPVSDFPAPTLLETEAAAELRRMHAEIETLRAGKGWQPIETAPSGVRILLGPGNAPVVGIAYRLSHWAEDQEQKLIVVHYNDNVLVAGYRCSEWHPLPAAPALLMENSMQEPKLGDRVRATMDGENWFTGTYVKESDIFAQYGVLRDDISEVRFFVRAEPHNHCCCDACKSGTQHASDCSVHNMPAHPNGPCDCDASLMRGDLPAPPIPAVPGPADGETK